MSDSIKYPLNISVKMYLNTGLERSKTVTLMTHRVSMSMEDSNAYGQSMLTEVMINNDNLNQDCIFYEIRMILRGYKHKYL
jgi:hypothetical protein